MKNFAKLNYRTRKNEPNTLLKGLKQNEIGTVVLKM